MGPINQKEVKDNLNKLTKFKKLDLSNNSVSLCKCNVKNKELLPKHKAPKNKKQKL